MGYLGLASRVVSSQIGGSSNQTGSSWLPNRSVNKAMEMIIKLPVSTAECEEGPIVNFNPGNCFVRYDSEDETGTVWTEVHFSGAVAIRFTPDRFVTEEMVVAYGKVCAQNPSSWISSLRSHAQHRLPDSVRHFLVYFDHQGCLEVLASNVRLK